MDGNQYVAVAACGCPLAVLDGIEARNVDDARYKLARGDRARLLRWRRTDVTVIHVSGDEYQGWFAPLLASGCPHGERGGAT